MGSGRWTAARFDEYASARYGVRADELEHKELRTQEVFRKSSASETLNPYGVMRRCHDSEEHPNTLPVILALDVTGSMGQAAVKTATRLNSIMTGIFCSGDIRDIEFCVMAIGDIHYDRAPIQISQFESDIRIAEQLDEVYFEGGGGSNIYESYSAAWYMGLEHCELHCWNRGKKGLLITMGDELPNPCLNAGELSRVTGDSLQADIDTAELLKRVREKYEVYHLSVDDPHSCYQRNQQRYNLDRAWTKLLGRGHYQVVRIDGLHEAISRIVAAYAAEQNGAAQQAGKAKIGHFW
ncbi:MAG: hypothetical protein IKH34_04765 [Oscillospiraceae bacterium]|nr:hypothetical protein [Oscillospiraceae bacterium]MBR3474358.1 hypothetical protein [Oscillospiraceae bacterium]